MFDVADSLQGLLPGLATSIQMTLAAVAVGIPLGFLAGLALNGKRRVPRVAARILVEIFRGFPALLTLYLVYFGLTQLVAIDRFASITVAFGVTVAAYTAEIFRAAIASVPKGQLEAAAALAMDGWQTTFRIIVPHVARVVVPPILGIVIIAFQGTALAYAIGGKELMGSAYSRGITTFQMLPELLTAAFLYLVVTSMLAWLEVITDKRAARIAGVQRPRGRAGRTAGLRTRSSV
ncbi:MAG: amino acid ABC transporter permease [Arthrobacter sp.]